MKSSADEFHLSFVKKEQVAKDAYAFYFSARGRSVSFRDFLPGQYIHIYLPIKNENGRGNSRMFTIASSPFEKQHIMIVTRIIQSLFKKTLFNLTPAALVKFYGPSGGFVLHENETREQVFLAGGIGITPFLSMLSYIDQKKLNFRVTLIVSFSTVEDIIYKEKLKKIEKRNSNVKVVYVVGRISKELITRHVNKPLDALYYIVGPTSMVDAMYKIVEGMGVTSKDILTENFVGY